MRYLVPVQEEHNRRDARLTVLCSTEASKYIFSTFTSLFKHENRKEHYLVAYGRVICRD